MPNQRESCNGFFDEDDDTCLINPAIIQYTRIVTNSGESVQVWQKNLSENSECLIGNHRLS